MNDLRGTDRQTFPKMIFDVTKALANLKNLECVDVG
jgi:hypothetical protein